MNIPSLALLSVVVSCFAFACSSSEDGSSSSPSGLFDVSPSPSVSSDEVTGVWETAEPTRLASGNTTVEQRLRFELRADHLVAAARCSTEDGSVEPVVATARASGKVTADAIQVGEPLTAKTQLGSIAVCGVQVAAGTLPRCASEKKTCFAIEDGTLSLYQASGAVAFTKVAD